MRVTTWIAEFMTFEAWSEVPHPHNMLSLSSDFLLADTRADEWSHCCQPRRSDRGLLQCRYYVPTPQILLNKDLVLEQAGLAIILPQSR